MRLKINKIGLLAAIFILQFSYIQAQSYNTAVGLRFSGDTGINLAHRIGNKTTLQLNHSGGIWGNDKSTSLYYVKHHSVLIRSVNFFTGIGLNGHYKASVNDIPSSYGLRPAGTLGGEFTIGRINMALDWSPTVDLSKRANKTINATTGLTIRYVFGKRTSKFKSWRKKTFKKKKK